MLKFEFIIFFNLSIFFFGGGWVGVTICDRFRGRGVDIFVDVCLKFINYLCYTSVRVH